MNEEDQKKADEAAWADARIACAAIRDADLDAAKNDIGAIDAAWSDYHDSCKPVNIFLFLPSTVACKNKRINSKT